MSSSEAPLHWKGTLKRLLPACALLVTACQEPAAYVHEASFEVGPEPTGIAVAGDRVFVGKARPAEILVLDREGGRQRARFGQEVLRRPMQLSLSDGRLYVADFFLDRIEVFASDGEHLGSLAPTGAGESLKAPGGADVAADGTLLVADTYHHRVLRLSGHGTVQRQWGETARPGRFSGRQRYPADLAALPGGGFVVAEGYNHRLSWYDGDGRRIRRRGGLAGLALGIPGPWRGWFRVASSVAARPDGGACAADFFNGRVQCFDADGKLDALFGRREARAVFGVSVDAQGKVWLTDPARGQVHRYGRPS